MLNIKSLLLENFRLFQGSSGIKLVPITVLTGPNNSGKSSIAGSINLMKCLDTTRLPYRFRLDSGNGIMSDDRNSKRKTSIGYDLYNIILGEDIKVLFTFGQEINSNISVKEITVKNKNDILFNFFFKDDKMTSHVDIGYFLNKLKDIKRSRSLYYGIESNFRDIRSASSTLKDEPDKSGIRIFRVDNDLKRKKILEYLACQGITVKEYERLFYLFGDRISFPGHEALEENFVSRMKRIFTDFDEDDILFNNKFIRRIIAIPAADLNELQLKAVLEKDFPDLFTNLSDNPSDSLNHIIDLLKLKGYNRIEKEFISNNLPTSKSLIASNVKKELSRAIENHLQVIFDESPFFRSVTELSLTGKGLLKEYRNYTNLRQLTLFCEHVLEKILTDVESDLEKSLTVSPEEVKPGYDLGDLVKSYSDMREKNNFLASWLKNFGISSNSLNHEGRGTNRLITMLLSIAGARQYNDLPDYNDDQRNYPRTLVFEEPETNLFPALQSQLADMFIDANKQLGLHFIIETHSVYLIKKLRYLVAKKHIDRNDVIIYYLDNPHNGSGKSPVLREIMISEDGDFTQEFGSGFFDESDSNLFYLRKFSKN